MDTKAQEALRDRVMARACEVFGNHIAAAVWTSQFAPQIGGPGPIRDQISTEAGAEAALRVLDELAKTVVPEPDPVPKRRRRWRR